MAESSLKSLRSEQFDYWAAHHLLNRAGFGGTPAQIRVLTNLGLDNAVASIVDFKETPWQPVEANAFDRNIMRPATPDERRRNAEARRSGDERLVEQFRQERQQRQREDRRQIAEIQTWWLRRMIESPRPLEEKMTLFWHGHFATAYRAIEDSYHMFLQNQLFRAHAAGNFKQLTHAILRDPAMLRYLNNNQNRRERPNENLARELMELFTLGEGNGYTENDIKEGARALTGYTFYDDEAIGPGHRQYQRLHDAGSKRIFGQVGNWDGDDFVNLIFQQPYTSEFICWKFYRYFVNDMPGDPDSNAQKFILRLAAKLRDSDYNLKPVLNALFKSEHFYDPSNRATLVKSPIQLIVQAVRSLHVPVRSLRALASAADLMGQNIMYPPSVKGWDGGRSWINTSTLFVRQNLILFLLTGRRPDAYAWQTDGTTFQAAHLVEHLKNPGAGGRVDPKELALYLLRFNLGTDPHPMRIDTLITFLTENAGKPENDLLIEAIALIAAMPEYQLC